MKLAFALFILALNSTAYAKNIMEALNTPGSSQNLTIPRIHGIEEKQEPPIVTAIGNLLGHRLQQMHDRKEKYASANFSIRDKWEYSCAETCACLTRRFAKTLEANNIPHRTILIRPGRDFEVRLRTGKGARSESKAYEYHEVTALMLAGRWRIVDVVATGSAKPIPLADWVKRLENPHLKYAEITSY